jgi:hypothetical protein
MSKAPKRKGVRERLDNISRDIEKLQAQESLLLQMLGEEPIQATLKATAKRALKLSVKIKILELRESQAHSGFEAAMAVELSEAGSDTIGVELETDRTLGGLCDWVEPEAPASVDLPLEGAAALKAAVVTVALQTTTGLLA